MRRPHILVVDADPSITKFLRANLIAESYEALTVASGPAALATIEKELPDMVILDLMLPGGPDGFEICKRVREWSSLPIIVLSARGDEADKVRCLTLGADDYITKPFGVDELMARVKAVFRRTQMTATAPPQPVLHCNELEINLVLRWVAMNGKEVNLTPTEYNLLQQMVVNTGKVLTHGMLLQRVWGPEYGNEKEYLHVFIGRLRHKLEPNPEKPKYIITVPGVGYKFRASN